MNDVATQQRFVQLRCEGWSFARIAEELKVSKPTLIKWSRKLQYDIQNQRAIHLEALRERWLDSSIERVQRLGEQLRQVEAELAKRDLTTLSTGRLFHLAESLRRQISGITGPMQFSSPLRDIPADEYHEQVQDWVA